MNYMEMNNEILNQCIRVIRNIKESPDHVVNQIIQSYEDIEESEVFRALQLEKINMDNNMLHTFTRTIKIASEIDESISECTSSEDIETLRGTINTIASFYNIQL